VPKYSRELVACSSSNIIENKISPQAIMGKGKPRGL